MKVALFHAWLHFPGGGERMIFELATRGKFDYDIYTSYYLPDKIFSEFRNVKVNNLSPNSEMKGVLQRGIAFGLKHILPAKIDLSDYDAFLVSTGGVAEFITFRNHNVPTFCYCHTPLRAVHDSSYTEHYVTGGKPLAYRGLAWTAKKVYRMLEKRAWSHFQRVFANSENTKRRIVNGGLAEDVDVIHPGVDIEKFQPSGVFEKVFFVPGRINKYKRQEMAIEAFKKFRKRHNGFRLVIAGSLHPKNEGYCDYLRELSSGCDDIEIIPNPSDDVYMDLYRKCYAVLFTAVNEDWGLTPIEANACGKLVVSVNEGGPRESIRNGMNGYLADSVDEFVELMGFLANKPDFVRSREKRCRSESEKYSWDRFVNALEEKLECLNEGNQ